MPGPAAGRRWSSSAGRRPARAAYRPDRRRRTRPWGLALLAAGEAHVHDHQEGEHRQGQQGRPLHEEPEQHQDEPDVLGMPHVGVGSPSREPSFALGRVEHLPGGGGQPEAGADKREAEDVEGPEVWVRLPTEHHLQEVPSIVREPVDPGEARLQPAGQHVDGQRETVHFGEERDHEGAEGPEGAPVAGRHGLREAEGEADEDRRVEERVAP